MSDHTIVIIRVMKIFFVQFVCVSCHPFLISSTSVTSVPFLSFIKPNMKCSLGISNFLEEISSLSHSVLFLYFFVLIAEEGFLISSCYSWNAAFRCLYLSFSPLLSPLFLSQLFVRPPQTAILLFCISFPWGWS